MDKVRLSAASRVEYHCWPDKWREAAIKAGLAVRTDYGSRILGGDDMRDRLEKFASALLAAYCPEKKRDQEPTW